MGIQYCFSEAPHPVVGPVDVNTPARAAYDPRAPALEHGLSTRSGISCVSLSNSLSLSEPVFSPLGGMPVLHAPLCPSHFKSYDEVPFFPWQLLCTCQKQKQKQKPCLPLLWAEVGAIRELGGSSVD